ncbi:MAG TPA: lamin tail domain-containing protein [Steroidobacteraceae bacterium]|nr:lamin tail domain-containing protein [Steroidobacteraceae bacterium]
MQTRQSIRTRLAVLAAVAAAALAAQTASAAIIISEVDPSGSSDSAYGADWFELTNTGSAAVNISGWRMDDNSNLFANSVALRGVTSLAPGQSVVFLEGTSSGGTDASIDANFEAAWFGTHVPSGLAVGNYGGSGVGLSQTSDAVNIFDSAGNLITRVDFGAASTGTFDNSAGLNNVTLTQVSVAGVNGAFDSVTGGEIGSPGVAPVPLPAAALLLLSGLGLFAPAARRRNREA